MKDKKSALVVGNELIYALSDRYVADFFNVINIGDVDEAYDRLHNDTDCFSIIFIGISSTEDEGLRLIERLHKCVHVRRIPVIVFSTETDRLLEKYSYEMGVTEYISMPFDSEIVAAKLRNIMLLYRYKDELEEERLAHIREAVQNQQNTIDFLANVIEARNMENGEHVSRVKGFTRILAEQVMRDHPEYGLDEKKVGLIASASSLHDLGKIMIRESVLLKPDKLTDEETEYMKTHTICGCLLLNKMKNMLFEDFYKTSYDICRSHHEKFDGSGYPDGLAGDDIPLSAQIVSIADCFDALTARRIYKPAYPPSAAYAMILSGECGVFSEKLLSSFRHCRARFINLAKKNAMKTDL